MANEDQLKRVKSGVSAWNDWRRNGNESVHLANADLANADLSNADLSDADLSRADLSGADLTRADLTNADLTLADLSGADLSGANLFYADLSSADLSGANLSEADLTAVNLFVAKMGDTRLTRATLQQTAFSNVDLSNVVDLATCHHVGPSTIDFRTLKISHSLPLAFLRGVGLPDNLIEYLPSLLGEAVQYYSCFISYSSKDDDFAQRLHADLQNDGVRCWFAPHDLPIGAETRSAIDAEIKVRDKVLLILSEHSIRSQWVKDEVEAAYEEESRRGQTVLFPIRLDGAVLETAEAWAAKLRRSRNIGDFRQWKDHDRYQEALKRVLRDLSAAQK